MVTRSFIHPSQIQSNFFKSLFVLLKYTPHFALRHEIQAVTIEVKVFELILNWTAKVLKMGDERLLKTML